MKVKQESAYAKLGLLIADYSEMLEHTGEEYLQLTADQFKEKAATKYGLTCDEYEMTETTVRLYRYANNILMLKIPDHDIIKKMADPSAWPLPGFFDKAYNCGRDDFVAGKDKTPRTPSEAEISYKIIKAKASAQSKSLIDTPEISKWRKDLRLELVHEQLGWYSITNCG